MEKFAEPVSGLVENVVNVLAWSDITWPVDTRLIMAWPVDFWPVRYATCQGMACLIPGLSDTWPVKLRAYGLLIPGRLNCWYVAGRITGHGLSDTWPVELRVLGSSNCGVRNERRLRRRRVRRRQRRRQGGPATALRAGLCGGEGVG